MRGALTAVFLICLAAVPGVASAAFERVPRNPADRLVREPIDDERYDRAERCRRSPMRGTRALEDWLDRHARGSSWGIMRCEKLGEDNYSLHAEGRALDWHLDAARRGERREASRIIALLLAPDRLGNERALARRMGVQEIIYNCRAWFAGGERMRPYSVCYDKRGRRKRRVNRTAAHRDHIHFGLSRRGGAGRTSFWAAARRADRRRAAARRADRRRAAARR
ncbi:MAG: hypothetical protein WD844_01605 [Thermoleophilaceae bacterium]